MAEALSSLDMSFLRLDGKHTPMHLGAVLLFDPAGAATGQAGARVMLAALRERAVRVPRLRCRLQQPRFGLGGARWIHTGDLDPAFHVRYHPLPRPAGRRELGVCVSGLLAVPLPRDRPLWQIHVIGPLADGALGVLVKVHHALADGLRAVGLGLQLFDGVEDADQAAPPHRPALRLLPGGAAGNEGQTGRSPGILGDQIDALGRRAGQAQRATTVGAAVLHHLLRHPAPDSPLNRPVGPRRGFSMLSLDLDDVHRVRKTHGGTVNDVLLAVVAGGLRGWLAQQGQTVAANLRVLVPVSRPHAALSDTAGNRLSGYLVDLPTGEPDPPARLRMVCEQMRANKNSGPDRGPGAFPLLADTMPALLHQLTAPLVGPLAGPVGSRLFNTVVTHVPLPDLPLRLAGARLSEIYPVVPLAPGQALGLAACTFARTVQLGLHADPDAVPGLDQLGEHLTSALAELLAS